MRLTTILLALAGLSACDRTSDKPTVTATPAQLTFEGADYRDEAAKLAHGKRLADVLDCTGCHGANLQGTNVTKDDPTYGDMNAPNLTLLLAKYSDADLDHVIRHGKPKDGRELWFMPVESYQFLSDADLAALVAHLRTFKPEGEQLPPIRRGPKHLAEVEKGLIGNAQVQIARYRDQPPPNLGTSHEWGRHLARTVCAGCHNNALQGYEGFAPDLNIAAAYSAEELETLLTTGKGKSKPDLGLMAGVAVSSLSKMTPRERQATIAYVKALANQPK